jgi:hypothetical protein
MNDGPRSMRRIALLIAFTLIAASVWVITSSAPGRAEVPGPHDVESRGDIWIDGNSQFDPANGVRKGRGTKKSPFVISGWDVSTVSIRDTSAYLIVKNNLIDRMHLNWNGGHVKLIGNDIGDLRVNENIERTGAPTSGRIARNHFDVVGQLRHFDGIFEDNVVGSAEAANLPFSNEQAVNFDGFNGARFRDNTIYGYVDVRLHGHHHSSSFAGRSHHHGMSTGGHHRHGAKAMKVNHSRRFHRVLVSNNRIYSGGPWALRYFDQAHSANDRTAASETSEALNRPHVHFTRVVFRGNRLFGSGLRVDVFNAEDKLHRKLGKGWVYLVNNTIKLRSEVVALFSHRDGIVVNQAQGLMLHIARNKVGWLQAVVNPADELDAVTAVDELDSVSGIRLYNLDHARVHILKNQLTRFEFGVYATGFSNSVKWWISRLATKDVDRRVYYDDSVANHPRRGR